MNVRTGLVYSQHMEWQELAWGVGGLLLGFLSALLKIVMPGYKDLLDEGRFLRADNELARAALGDQEEKSRALAEEVEALRAERDRLRRALREKEKRKE